jgi:hypothetical protein
MSRASLLRRVEERQFYVLAESVVRTAAWIGATFTIARLEEPGATRCDPRDLRQHIEVAARSSRSQ